MTVTRRRRQRLSARSHRPPNLRRSGAPPSGRELDEAGIVPSEPAIRLRRRAVVPSEMKVHNLERAFFLVFSYRGRVGFFGEEAQCVRSRLQVQEEFHW